MIQNLLRIGNLAATAKQLGELGCLVRGAGYTVDASLELQDCLSKPFPNIDIWVVNLDMNSPLAQAAIDRLDGLEVPVIYEEDVQLVPDEHDTDDSRHQEPPTAIRQRRERRLGETLRQLVRESAKPSVENDLKRASYVWVLGASTGGPEAVAEFLKGIPDDLPDVAFLYTQHIYQQALESLRRVVSNNCNWGIQNTDEARVIREKTVYLISPANQVELTETGVISPLDEPWGGDFQPSIDHVIAKVARVYRKRGGAIVFSGMGEDGANSCKLLHHRGGQIWIQSKASSTIDSMPHCVEKTGCVQFSGTPKELAQQLVSFQKQLN